MHPDAPTTVDVSPSGPLRGDARVPGDKSISHRSVLFSTLARGTAVVRGLSKGEDVLATVSACRALGATIDLAGDTDPALGASARVVGTGGALVDPPNVLDCGNSGTSIRLLLGAVAPSPAFAVLTGDDSLRRRPMGRVVGPLTAMGARIDGREGGSLAPLAVRGAELRPMDHDLAVSSAQLKSALLLAGRACGVRVREPRPSRDHTERMLASMGADLSRSDDGWWTLRPAPLAAVDVDVPGDLSAAAFLLVAGAIVPGSSICVRGVGVNPTRTGVLDVLAAMGADVVAVPVAAAGPEPQADLVVRAGGLKGTTIAGELALRSLDELPVLAIAAAVAEGTTLIRDAVELRVKESDRIERVAAGLRAVGIAVETFPDGLAVEGGRPRGPAVIDASGDHRIAMSFAVLGLVTEGGLTISRADEVRSSWPRFFPTLAALAPSGAAPARSGP